MASAPSLPKNYRPALFLGATVLPLLFPAYWLHVSILALYYAMLASSWNLLAGYTGQISFAHAAFAGAGAYVSGILAVSFGCPPWLGLFAAVAATGLLGLGLGALCLRMGGIYLSLATLGFSEIVRLVLVNEDRWTRGTMGLQVPGLLAEYSKPHYYLLFLAAALLFFAILRKLTGSETGLAFRAVLNDETAAASLGIDTRRMRLYAFALSSALAGLAGALYGHTLMILTPSMASLDQMFLILAMAVIGGLGTLSGPIIGAVLLTFLSEKIRVYGECHLLVFGLAALAIVKLAPDGLVPFFARDRAR